MLTLSNEKIKVQVIFAAFDDTDEYNDAVECVLQAVAADPIVIDFTNNATGIATLEGPDAVCGDVIELMRYNGFNVLDSETIASKPTKRPLKPSQENLRKAA